MTLTTQTGALRSPPGDPDPDAVAVAQSVCQQVQPMQGYLFGSRARGDYDNDSDVDIAITVEDVSFLTAEESSGRVKKSTLANSMAREGTLIIERQCGGLRTRNPKRRARNPTSIGMTAKP